MVSFFVNYWGTMLVGALVLAIVALVVYFMARDKKRGKSSCGGCGCGCSGCPSADMCHKK